MASSAEPMKWRRDLSMRFLSALRDCQDHDDITGVTIGNVLQAANANLITGNIMPDIVSDLVHDGLVVVDDNSMSFGSKVISITDLGRARLTE